MHRARSSVPRQLFRPVMFLLVLGSTGLLGLAFRGMHPRRAMTTLQDGGPLPVFSFTDQEGHRIRRADLLGSVWIADFIFTRCAGQCPLMSAQMATLQNTFDPVPGVQFVSFTVDPLHDTPTVLRTYAEHYGARNTRWHFLTGDHAAIVTLAQDGFHLGVAEGGSSQEPITHSIRLVLIDQRGHVRGYYDATEAEAMHRLIRDARQLSSTTSSP